YSGLPFSRVEPGIGPGTEHIGHGACFLDFDGDGHPDLFLAAGGAQGGMALFHNTGRGQFEDVTQKAGLDPKLRATACAAGDFDNDGHTDLAVTTGDRILLLHNQGNGMFKDVSDAAGIRSQNAPLAITFVDYDHDGDLDLFITSREGRKNVIWRNNGNGTFTDVTADLGLTADAPG